MTEPFKYQIKAECEPSPAQYAGEIVEALRSVFNLTGHECSGNSLTVELESSHLLADGVFKDLADALIDQLTARGLRLRSGVINRVDHNPLGTFIGVLGRGVLGRQLPQKALHTGAAVCEKLTGFPVMRSPGGALSGGRLVPVMFFHRDVVLDLLLSAKSRRPAANPTLAAD